MLTRKIDPLEVTIWEVGVSPQNGVYNQILMTLSIKVYTTVILTKSV